MTVATNALYTPGAIGNVTKRTGDIGQGLEPDEGQPSRPVLRGPGSGNTHRLPGAERPRASQALMRHAWRDRAYPGAWEAVLASVVQVPSSLGETCRAQRCFSHRWKRLPYAA